MELQGCDASLLLDDTGSFTGEKTAVPNANSLRGFEVIDTIKSQVEKLCPNTVSCADILAVAARDSVACLGGPTWKVELGRRDSTTASKTTANNDIPNPFMNLPALINSFKKQGLDQGDLVALSGGHTIGFSQCNFFKNRIYNESNIDQGFARNRQKTCPRNGGDTKLAPLDQSAANFDTRYFTNLVKKRGLLHSDQVLFNGGSTDNLVKKYSSNAGAFSADFAKSMIKMGNIKPLTGRAGQIRRNCYFVKARQMTWHVSITVTHASIVKLELETMASSSSSSSSSSSFSSMVVVILSLLLFFSGSSSAQLSTSYYSKTCPNVLTKVKSAVQSAISKERRAGASLLRLHFHDCFVNGCDGSVLLDDTSNFTGEKNANPNRNSARGFDVVDNIKSVVEKACPGVVSCADILAIAARDSVVILGGDSWDVKLGRRDARTASQSAANTGIPQPTSSLSNLISSFQAHGLSTKDMVALSGAHTIGQARCTSFRARIYNETNNLDSSLAKTRQGNCPRTSGSGDNNLAPLDVQTPTSFDNNYFKNLISNKGLLHSDQQLFNGGSTDSQVRTYSNNPSTFSADFAAAMIKMGDIKPLTGSNGEVRKNCRRIN
ncbi:Plant peroxidase [Macleaya cordata]|uniref:peroxidase n=1 Tax=Macleaya cordata TaxID=56857 RepID=A0A200QQG5_MACCD|nr:Plant peroxidase [Macleaya cordata]